MTLLLEVIDKQKNIIDSLVEKVRIYHDKYGSEYLGGRPFQSILQDIEELNKSFDKEFR